MSEQIWRWIIRGFGAVVGMLVAHHREAGPCPLAELNELRGHIEAMSRVEKEQRDAVQLRSVRDPGSEQGH